MCLTSYEESMIQAFYEYNRIPVWIFNKDKILVKTFFSGIQQNVTCVLSKHMTSMMERTKSADFDILCYEDELYSVFTYLHNSESFYCLQGPMLLFGLYTPISMRTLSFAPMIPTKELDLLLEILPVISLASFSSTLRIMMLLLGRNPLGIDEISSYPFLRLQDTVTRTFIHELFENREEVRKHSPYSHELALLHCVKEGDVALLESTFKALPETKYGIMSRNPQRQLLYGCIANTTLVTRYAIEGGLDEELAFTLSDVYIKQMENCRTSYELNMLNEKMALDFTKQVANLKTVKHPVYIEPIAKCIDYIFMNFHERITLDTLAKEVNLTPKYLSNLFHKETGQTLSSYIEDKRINEAKNLLVYSEYSSSQISNYLSYYSHSYFISVFKRSVGMTPKEYRRRYSRSSWEVKN